MAINDLDAEDFRRREGRGYFYGDVGGFGGFFDSFFGLEWLLVVCWGYVACIRRTSCAEALRVCSESRAIAVREK